MGWLRLEGSSPGIRTLKPNPPLIWTYPEGARQLRRGAPRRRAPKSYKSLLQNLVSFIGRFCKTDL